MRVGGVSPSPAMLNHEINMRNYKSQTGFKGEEPWVYPKTKNFKIISFDKGSFPYLPKLLHQKEEDKVIMTISDPN